MRIVEPDLIKFDQICSWLHECKASHGSDCIRGGEKNESSILLYALNCFDKTVVPLSNNERYAAIYYVWGKDSGSARFTTAPNKSKDTIVSTANDFPPTYKDAMQVVRNTGLRYLWVDRYCISQNDPAQKKQTILNMNHIYAGAEFTIVALFGADPQPGLPGVSSIPRSGTQQVTTASFTITSSLPRLATVIDQSV